MQELLASKDGLTISNEFDSDAQMKQALDCLKIENSQLRQLVVRLSETIIKNVVCRR